MTMHERSVESTTVDDVYEETLQRGAIVDAATPLTDVVEALEYKEAMRALFVVDPRERYVGVITRTDVLGWLEHNLEAPQAHDAFPWDALGDSVRAASAEDAINPRSAEVPVEPREPVDAAVRKMLTGRLAVVPVVHPDGSIKGELTLTRAIQYALEGA